MSFLLRTIFPHLTASFLLSALLSLFVAKPFLLPLLFFPLSLKKETRRTHGLVLPAPSHYTLLLLYISRLSLHLFSPLVLLSGRSCLETLSGGPWEGSLREEGGLVASRKLRKCLKPPQSLREARSPSRYNKDSLASSSVSFFLVSLSFSLDFPHSLSITFYYPLSLIPSLQSMPYHSLLSTLF